MPSCALSAVRYVIRVVTDPEIPNNEGCYRMIHLKIPEKSILNPQRPAAVNCRSVTLRRVVDATLGAMAQALPDRVPAANNGHPLQGHFGGFDKLTGRAFILSEMGTGGMGARPTKDVIDCSFTDTSNASGIPIEVAESMAPMRIHYFRLRTDSGGAGRFRGGCGFEKEYECLCDDVVLSHRGARHYPQRWVVIRADGTEEVIPSKKTIHLMKGDRVVMWTSGGGGFGSPLDRPPEHVLEDVLDGKVGVEAAKDLYGVIVKEGKLRHGETERMRARMRNAAMMDL